MTNTIECTVHDILHHSLKFYQTYARPGKLKLNHGMPFLTEPELKLLYYIECTPGLRPSFYLKRDGSYTDLSDLLIPKDPHLYSSQFKAPYYIKLRKSLMAKGLLYDTPYGMVMNHLMVPFENKKAMAHLVKITRIPLPPM